MQKLKSILNFPLLGGLGFGFALATFLLWEIKWFLNTSPTSKGFILGSSYSIALLLLTSIYFLPKLQRTKNSTQVGYFTFGIIIFATAMLLSNWTSIHFGLLTNPHIALVALYTGILISAIHTKFTWGDSQWRLSLLTICTALISVLLLTSNFKALFTDDHGPVLYRLQLLKENFPNIPVFNSEWNAGYDWRDFFATGIFNIFFIFSPLIYSLPIATAYTYVLPLVLFAILPISTLLGARLLGVSKNGGIIAAILATTSSSIWYKWGLSYGSMGFVCSTALLPLSFSLLLYIVKNEKTLTWGHVIASIVTLTLTIFWSAQGISLLPFLLFCLLKIKKFLSNKKLLVFAIGMVMINVPWIYSFLNVSKVISFVQTAGTKHSKVDGVKIGAKIKPAVIRANHGELKPKVAIKRVRDFASKLNPLILFLMLPALFVSKLPVFYNRAFIGTSLFLFILGILGPSYKPQLELDRLLIVMSLLLCIPLGSYLDNFITSLKNLPKALKYIAIFCLISLFTSGFYSTLDIAQNKGFYTYKLWPDEIEEFNRLLNSHSDTNSDNGRILFSGFVLHEFGGGHLAPLPTYIRRPMIASSPVHNLWWYTDVIPEEYRSRSNLGIQEYLDLMNASIVIAHENNWKSFFRADTDNFIETGVVGKFVIFKRNAFPDTYFLSGKGKTIEQTSSQVVLNLHTDSAIVKFNYYPFLTAEGCESISPHEISPDTIFISLQNCTPGKVTIKSLPLHKRVL